MKKELSILAFVVVASLASCSKDDSVGPNPNFPSDGVIRLSTGVNVPTSRAGLDNTNFSMFNLSISDPKDPAYFYYACMKKVDSNWDSYSAENGGLTALVMKWKDKTTPITVVALCANNKNRILDAFTNPLSIDSVLTDQSKPDSVKASDILYLPKTEISPTNTNYFTSAGALKLELPHFLSKLRIELTLGTEFFTKDPKVSKVEDLGYVQVCGTKTKFSWNPSTSDPFSLEDTSISTITTCYESGSFELGSVSKQGKAVYECIVVPQDVTVADFSVLVSIKGVIYKLNLQKDESFLGGNIYKIPMAVTRVSQQMDNISVSKWASGSNKFMW